VGYTAPAPTPAARVAVVLSRGPPSAPPSCETRVENVTLALRHTVTLTLFNVQPSLLRHYHEAGFWAGEEDEADMYFGSSTQEALCYFQASAGLSETGVVDMDTWQALIGQEKFAWGPVPGAIGFEEEEGEDYGEFAIDPAPAAAAAAAAAPAVGKNGFQNTTATFKAAKVELHESNAVDT
jgi:hypothetical protein